MKKILKDEDLKEKNKDLYELLNDFKEELKECNGKEEKHQLYLEYLDEFKHICKQLKTEDDYIYKYSIDAIEWVKTRLIELYTGYKLQDSKKTVAKNTKKVKDTINVYRIFPDTIYSKADTFLEIVINIDEGDENEIYSFGEEVLDYLDYNVIEYECDDKRVAFDEGLLFIDYTYEQSYITHQQLSDFQADLKSSLSDIESIIKSIAKKYKLKIYYSGYNIEEDTKLDKERYNPHTNDSKKVKDEDSQQYIEKDYKQVYDSDGFLTDYTMYYDTKNDRYVFVFGDKDIYKPEDEYFDWECDSEKEAKEWFDNYNGFEEDLIEDSKPNKDEIIFKQLCELMKNQESKNLIKIVNIDKDNLKLKFYAITNTLSPSPTVELTVKNKKIYSDDDEEYTLKEWKKLAKDLIKDSKSIKDTIINLDQLKEGQSAKLVDEILFDEAETAKEVYEDDYDKVFKEKMCDDQLCSYIPAGTILTLKEKYGPAGGWPCFTINGVDVDLCGDLDEYKGILINEFKDSKIYIYKLVHDYNSKNIDDKSVEYDYWKKRFPNLRIEKIEKLNNVPNSNWKVTFLGGYTELIKIAEALGYDEDDIQDTLVFYDSKTVKNSEELDEKEYEDLLLSTTHGQDLSDFYEFSSKWSPIFENIYKQFNYPIDDTWFISPEVLKDDKKVNKLYNELRKEIISRFRDGSIKEIIDNTYDDEQFLKDIFDIKVSYDSKSVKDVKPRKGESKEDFISRFMEETKKEYPDQKQRLAVAYSYWDRRNKKSTKDSLDDESREELKKYLDNTEMIFYTKPKKVYYIGYDENKDTIYAYPKNNKSYREFENKYDRSVKWYDPLDNIQIMYVSITNKYPELKEIEFEYKMNNALEEYMNELYDENGKLKVKDSERKVLVSNITYYVDKDYFDESDIEDYIYDNYDEDDEDFDEDSARENAIESFSDRAIEEMEEEVGQEFELTIPGDYKSNKEVKEYIEEYINQFGNSSRPCSADTFNWKWIKKSTNDSLDNDLIELLVANGTCDNKKIAKQYVIKMSQKEKEELWKSIKNQSQYLLVNDSFIKDSDYSENARNKFIVPAEPLGTIKVWYANNDLIKSDYDRLTQYASNNDPRRDNPLIGVSTYTQRIGKVEKPVTEGYINLNGYKIVLVKDTDEELVVNIMKDYYDEIADMTLEDFINTFVTNKSDFDEVFKRKSEEEKSRAKAEKTKEKEDNKIRKSFDGLLVYENYISTRDLINKKFKVVDSNEDSCYISVSEHLNNKDQLYKVVSISYKGYGLFGSRPFNSSNPNYENNEKLCKIFIFNLNENEIAKKIAEIKVIS